jgi:hypothetical protein
MENKKTSELLDLLQTLVSKDGRLEEGWQEAYDELKSRTPFIELLEGDVSGGDSLQEKVEDLESAVKELKRHKHDEKNGDVLIRI